MISIGHRRTDQQRLKRGSLSTPPLARKLPSLILVRPGRRLAIAAFCLLRREGGFLTAMYNREQRFLRHPFLVLRHGANFLHWPQAHSPILFPMSLF